MLGQDMSAVEVQALLRATRDGNPFLFLRDDDGHQLILALHGERMILGRAPGSDIEIAWDSRVSGIHAQLERRARQWLVEDDGLSRNGTWVNGERVPGQRILRDGDLIRVGETLIGFRDPEPQRLPGTMGVSAVAPPSVSDAQRRVLVALCRPYAGAPRFATPASNQQIARELFLSVDAVKSHLRVLFSRFGLEGVPQNEKRAQLVERALSSGLVREADL